MFLNSRIGRHHRLLECASLVGLLLAWVTPAVLSAAAERPTAVGAPIPPAAGGTEERAVRDTLDAIRRVLLQGDCGGAEERARALLRHADSAPSVDSMEVAWVYDLLVESLWRCDKSRNPDAQVMADRALQIKRNRLGPSSSELASSLDNYGNLLRTTGDLPGARLCFEQSLAMREKVLDVDDVEVARSLNNLANVLSELRDSTGARIAYQRALAIREKALGPDHLDVALVLYNFQQLLADGGAFAEARPLLERVLSIREKAYGGDHLEVAACLVDLGNMLQDLGQFSEAQALYRRALVIREKSLGPDHPEIATTIACLGVALARSGDYAGARPLLERALAIRERALGPDHADVSQSLNHLGLLLRATGDLAGARPLLERALAIEVKLLGPDDPAVAQSESNLAILFEDLEDFPAARRLYERALAIQEKVLGPDHIEVGQNLHNLGNLLLKTGEYAEAQRMHERALLIEERTLGPEHVYYSETLSSLGRMHEYQHDPAGALPLYERALAIRLKALGPAHPDVASAYDNLAAAYTDSGDSTAAMRCALRAESISREHLRLTCRTLPERQALDYAAAREGGLDRILSLAAATDPAQAWDALIQSRAVVLDEMASRHRAVVVTRDSATRILAESYFGARQQLADVTVRGPGELPPGAYRAFLDSTYGECERLERELSERSAVFREERVRAKLGLAEVLSALPSGAVLVGYARYLRYAPASSARGGARATVPSYIGFVVEAGGRPVVVELGDAGSIDSLIAHWSAKVSRVPVGPGRLAREAEYRRAGEALRRRVWDPLLARVGESKRVLVVPDGALNLVSLASLPAGGSRFLLETGPLVHYLSAERDLLQSDPRDRGDSGLLVVGGPDFDAAAAVDRAVASDAYRGASSSCGSFQTLRFGPLPSAALEGDEILGIWNASGAHASRTRPADLLTGVGASEGAFKSRAAGRGVLHLATHGFFLAPRCETSGPAAALAGSELPQENPLLLSGLALAGANRRGAAGPNEEDGVLTAEEVAALDLSGADWAVLSGCETGAGQVRGGEGVFGLRRAFQIAGARTVIMSLWAVEDEAAREWMVEMYRGRIQRGSGTAEAIQDASLKMLDARRAAGQSTHPFYWAAFIGAGDWR